MSSEPTPQSPFVETDEQASLRRIAEAGRARKAAKARMARLKEEWSEAKAAYRKAMEEEQATVEAETTELPLFPRLKGHPSPKPTPVVDPVTGEEEAPDAFRATFLSELKGIPIGALVTLGENNIQTCGDVDCYLESGKRLSDIKGLDAAAIKKILKEVARFRESLRKSGS